MTKPKMKATGLLIAVFVSGVAVGGAGAALADRTEPEPAPRPSYAERLEDELGLTPDQRVFVEEAMKRYTRRVHDIEVSVRSIHDSIGRGTREEIMGILDERQQALYAEYNVGVDRRRADYRRKQDAKFYDSTTTDSTARR